MSNEKLEIIDGDYVIGDRVIKKSEVGKLFEKNGKTSEDELELQEGECSGPINLNG